MKLENYIKQFSERTFPIYYDEHEVDWFYHKQKLLYQAYLKAPSYRDLLKKAEQQLSDAIWNNNYELIEELKSEIFSIKFHIQNGEEKPVNF